MARYFSMTFGVMPTREQFDEAWRKTGEEASELRSDCFHFGNDKRLGTDVLTQDELWNELVKARAKYDRLDGEINDFPDEVGDWISSVLGQLGIEWI
jgi:hypothetical protein